MTAHAPSARRRTAAWLPLLVATLAGRAVAAPPKAPAAPAAAPAATKAPVKLDPRTEAILAWVEGIFSWGAGETTLDEITQAKIRGFRLYKVSKSFAADQRFNDFVYAALDDAGRTGLIGELFVDENRLKAPAPVRSEADLASLKEQLARFLRGRFRVSLDPATDRPSWKGIKITMETGYGPYDFHGYLTESDGALLVLGRFWDRKRSIADQRKEMIKLASTPSVGPADATVTVVEYSDLECPFCKRRSGDWETLVDKLGKDLKIRRYFKSFPLVNDHPWAFRGASAARCFFEKDPALFFRWKSNVYARQEQMTVADLDSFALDFAVAGDYGEAAFKSCYLQDHANQRVLADLAEGFALRVRSTPSYFVDGVLVSWYTDNMMEEYLRKTYLKGAGLPLPPPKATPFPAKP